MYTKPQQRESFIIQVRDSNEGLNQIPQPTTTSSPKFNLSSMKLFDRFRRILMGFIFSFPSSRSGRSQGTAGSVPRRRSCDSWPDPPKTSCSSSTYYSSNSHYNEAIADCIEFLNKSSQEGNFDARKSDVMV